MDWTESRVSLGERPFSFKYSRGLFVAVDRDRHSIVFFQSPSVTNVDSVALRRVNMGMKISDIHIDQSIDMLVIVEKTASDNTRLFQPRIHVLSLSDLTPYPRARQSTLDENDIEVFRTSEIELAGDILGCLFDMHSLRLEKVLVLWNYIDGTVLASLSFGNFSLGSFTFLDPETFLVARNKHSVNRIAPSIDLYVINAGSSQPITCVKSFKLPAFTTCIYDSPLVFELKGPLPHAARNSSNLYPIQENCVITLGWYPSGLDALYGHRIFATCDIFRVSRPITAATSPEILEWDVWGPMNTRIVLLEQRAADLQGVCGSRAIAVTSTPSHEKIMLLDFSKDAMAACKCTPLETGGSNLEGVHSYIVPRGSPTILPDQNVFAAGCLSTSLPYCIAVRYFHVFGFGLERIGNTLNGLVQ